jgi:3-isopropylmalate/(R)-2-methylmalate dehydratase small subunit
MEPIRLIRSHTVVLPRTNIDTDQIIPARFLTTTGRSGLGAALFADWRYDAAGAPIQDFPLNRAAASGAQVLVAGSNFGCGSSREHAAWALYDWGIRAVISSEFADIFQANALKNGLLPVRVDGPTHGYLVGHPGVEVAVDLESLTLTLPDGTQAPFPIEPFARRCLLDGVDELGYLLARSADIGRFEARRVP